MIFSWLCYKGWLDLPPLWAARVLLEWWISKACFVWIYKGCLKLFLTWKRKVEYFIEDRNSRKAFDKIKRTPQKSPVPYISHSRGIFHLYLDTSKFWNIKLYKIQNGLPRLIGHASMRIPPAAQNYSINVLELCGLSINIACFSHLTRNKPIWQPGMKSNRSCALWKTPSLVEKLM